MTRSKRDLEERVVITGVGAVSPIGNTAEEYWQNLLSGVSGVREITYYDTRQLPVHIGAEVKGFDAARYMDAKEARRMSRPSQFAVAAARMAWTDAGLDAYALDHDRAGVYMGSVGAFEVTEAGVVTLHSKGYSKISPFMIGAGMTNAPAVRVAMAFHLHGFNSTVNTACAAGSQAIGEAAAVIRRGVVDLMIAGGTDSGITPLAIAGFGQMRALSTRMVAPELASRPFDGERDGLVLAEGSGVLVLESLSHALARGARIYAELAGFGSSNDAYHVAAPDPEGQGACKAMAWALEDAGLAPSEVDYISAHATSTPAGDAAEIRAVKCAFGEHAYRVPISAAKSMIGHPIAAGGALEAVACILTLRDQKIHPTINQTTPDPDCDLDVVPNLCRAHKVDTILSNSFGFGGQNACLVFRRFA